MPSKNVETVLSNLQKYGVSSDLISNLQKELDKNKNADKYLESGIIRRNQFTEYVTKAEEEKKVLENKVKELATLHDVSSSHSLDDETKKSLLEKVTAIEDFLIEEGYDEDEVRKISFKEKQTLTESKRVENLEAENKTKELLQAKEEEEEMPSKNYVDEETLNSHVQTGMATMAMNTMAVNSQVLRFARKYEKLYGKDADDNLIDSFPEKVLESISKGEQKTVDQIADEHFKLSDRVEKNREDEVSRRIEAARIEERNKISKETGIPSRASRFNNGGSPIFRGRQKFQPETSTTQTSQTTNNNNSQEPKNVPAGMVELANGKVVPIDQKTGIPHYHMGRGTQEERVEKAAERYNAVIERIGEDGMAMGFGE
jgi:hypothetical protein